MWVTSNFQKNRKKLLSILLVMLCISSTSCKRETKIPADTLVIGIENEIKNLDLRFANDSNSVHVSRIVLQSLVSIGENLMAEPDLALSVEVKDSKVFTFKLPTNVYFHDGIQLTSKDVLYNFQQASGPTSKIRSSFEDVEAFEAPTDDTFIIRLKKARPSFLAGEVSAIRIYPSHLGESKSQTEHPIGSGPYKFIKRKYRDLIFERYDAYRSAYGGTEQPLPSFKTVIVRSIEDPTTRFLSLVGGDIDILINSLSPRRIQESESDARLQVIRAPGSSYQYLGFNMNNTKFKDSRVRKALSLAIDREQIIRHKLKGYAQAASSVLTPQNFYFNPAVKSDPYDPEKARALLKEAKVENLNFEIRSSSDRDVVSMLQIIQEQWKAIGVETRLRSTEFATFFADVQKGNAEVFSLRWTAVAEPDLLNKIFHSKETPPGRNRTYFNNPEVDRLLDTAAQETRIEKRRQDYFKVQELIAANSPYLSLWYPDNISVATRQLKNFKLHPTGSWMGFLRASKELSQ